MLTLDDIFDHLQQAHMYENYIMALCEFHEDGSPSMMVSEHGFRCKSCREHGSLEYLYQKVSGRVVIREYTKNPAA